MAGEIKSFRDLMAWQKAIDLCQAVYALTRAFPAHEQFGLTAQMRRLAVSVPSNIALGYGRQHRHDYARFLNIALGALCELETYMVLAVRLGLANADAAGTCTQMIRKVDRILCALIRTVRDSAAREDQR